MKVDQYGQIILNENDLCEVYLRNPTIHLDRVLTEGTITLSHDLELELPVFQTYELSNDSIKTFDKRNQQNWSMPQSYKNLAIDEWVLLQCTSQAELQRCGAELIRYVELDLLSLLQYLKYLVDTMRLNNIVWGVGRGSSVSSYVLYKIGVHKIDSMYYDLDFTEFLR